MQSQGPNYLAGSTKPLPGSENVLALELRELGELRGIGELFHVHKILKPLLYQDPAAVPLLGGDTVVDLSLDSLIPFCPKLASRLITLT